MAKLLAIGYHCQTLWLFTYSDLKTIVGPSFVFGTANAFAAGKFGLIIQRTAPYMHILQRSPLMLLWIWLNLLPFTINNQRSHDAMIEDAVNKPWRALPSRRISPRQAGYLVQALYPLALASSLLLGGVRQSLGLVILGTWYNVFGGGDNNCCIRNFINAFGYICFASGAMEVALNYPLPLETCLIRWFSIVAAIIFTTVHVQDMYDQGGDRMRKRKTVPLVIGDVPARRSIAIAMLLWGGFCPIYWNGGLTLVASSITLAIVIAARTLLLTTVEADRLTFKMWNSWVTLIFCLPFLSQEIH